MPLDASIGSREPGWEEGDNLHKGAGKYFDKLPEDMQRQFDVFRIPARVFVGLPRRTLYEVFKRYNTGSEKLKPAEIRKSIYQGSPLHDVLYRIAGENGIDKLTDGREKQLARSLAQTMKKKTARYGAYNFVGRCLAFAHCTENLTVAGAINTFMDDNLEKDPEPFRAEFLDALEAAFELYPSPLCAQDPDTEKVSFHEWIATIQIVSTIRMLEHIKAGRTSMEAVREAIEGEWPEFVGGKWNEEAKAHVGGLLRDKQNTSSHWGRQREWIAKLEARTGAKPPTPPA